MRPVIAIAILVSITGCYAYAPVAEPAPEPGTRIRAHVTDAATAELGPRFGPGVATLRGRLLRMADDDVSLSIEAVETHRRGELYWNGEVLRIERSKISLLESNRFSAWRTALFVGAVIAGGLLVDNSFGTFGIISDGDEDNEPINVN